MGYKPQKIIEIDLVVQEAIVYSPGDIKHTDVREALDSGQY